MSTSDDDPSPYRPPRADARPTRRRPRPHEQEGDATGGVIPYKNPAALTAYYLGLFSLFPVLGLFLAVPAFIFGIIGLNKRKENPAVKGSVHAWIGIIMGGLLTVVAYPGHEGGREEASAVIGFSEALDPEEFSITRHPASEVPGKPFLIAIEQQIRLQ